MVGLEADPRFDRFSALFPYDDSLDPLEGRPGRWYEDISIFPPTATDSRCVGTDQTIGDALDLSTIRKLLGELPPDHSFTKSPPSEDVTRIPIDIDRLFRCAVCCGDLGLAKQLHAHNGADFASRDTFGMSPLMYTMWGFLQRLSDYDGSGWNDTEVLEYIRDKLGPKAFDSEMNHEDSFGQTAWLYAIAGRASDLLDFCFNSSVLPRQPESLEPKIWLERSGEEGHMLIPLLFTSLQSHLDIPMYIRMEEKIRSPLVVTSLRNYISNTSVLGSGIPRWLHVPHTSVSLIFAVLRRLRHLNFPNEINWPDVQSSSFLKTFRSPTNTPGDPLLQYRPPGCDVKLDRSSIGGTIVPIITIVFPCFSLRPMGQFRSLRGGLRAESKAAQRTWEDAVLVSYIERTLDETYYPSLDEKQLRARNEDQVATREGRKTLEGLDLDTILRPILTIPQLWIWIYGELLITAFCPRGLEWQESSKWNQQNPQCWTAGRGLGINIEPLQEQKSLEVQVAALLVEEVHSFGESQVMKDAFVPLGSSDSRSKAPLDVPFEGTLEYQSPLDLYELGVVRIMADVQEYTGNTDLSTDDSHVERFLMRDITDIREELVMVDEVLSQQETVLNQFVGHCEQMTDQKAREDALERLRYAQSELASYRKRVEKIIRDAERVDHTVAGYLNLKHTFASIRDARAAANEAKTSVLLAVAVIGFTVITILFAPLAFMTALFALDIDELARHKTGKGDDAVYPSWYIFVTFLAAEVVTLTLTGLLVWLCLHHKDRLTFWAANYTSKKEQGTSAQAAPSASTISSVPPIKEKPPASQQSEATTGAERNDNAQPTRSSVLSRRRPRPADPVDSQERGEIANGRSK